MEYEALKKLPRATLQKIARREKIKANGKTEDIIRQLLSKHPEGVPDQVLEDVAVKEEEQELAVPGQGNGFALHERGQFGPPGSTTRTRVSRWLTDCSLNSTHQGPVEEPQRELSAAPLPNSPRLTLQRPATPPSRPHDGNTVRQRANAAIQTEPRPISPSTPPPSRRRVFDVLSPKSPDRNVKWEDWHNVIGRATRSINLAAQMDDKIGELLMIQNGILESWWNLESALEQQRNIRLTLEKHYFSVMKLNPKLWDGTRGGEYREHYPRDEARGARNVRTHVDNDEVEVEAEAQGEHQYHAHPGPQHKNAARGHKRGREDEPSENNPPKRLHRVRS